MAVVMFSLAPPTSSFDLLPFSKPFFFVRVCVSKHGALPPRKGIMQWASGRARDARDWQQIPILAAMPWIIFGLFSEVVSQGSGRIV